jgi:hypothetical protein
MIIDFRRRGGAMLALGLMASACAETSDIAIEASQAGPSLAAASSGAYGRGGARGAANGLRNANVEYVVADSAAMPGLPVNARPGECYVRALIPARYDQVSERILRKPASVQIDVTPARYEDVQERVLIRPASKRVEAIAAVYEEVEEKVLVRPATKRVEAVPATYRTVTEQVLARPAYKVWKRSSELTDEERARQNLPSGVGDILCLVEMPAQYRTVAREVVATPATTREITVPAEYATVRKMVLKSPATTREVVEPAEYTTVTVKKQVEPAREKRIEVPAQYDTIARQVVRSPQSAEWRQVLCETNATPDMLGQLQRALRRAGFDPGRDDGRVDERTMSAVRAFQQARSLPVDNDRYISMSTVRLLGVGS